MSATRLSIPCATSMGRIGRASCCTRRANSREMSSPPGWKTGFHWVQTSMRQLAVCS